MKGPEFSFEVKKNCFDKKYLTLVKDHAHQISLTIITYLKAPPNNPAMNNPNRP